MYDQPDAEQAYQSIALFSEPLIKWYGTIGLVALRKQRPDLLIGNGILSKFLSPSLGIWAQINRLAAKHTPFEGELSPLSGLFDELLGRQTAAMQVCVKRVEGYLGGQLQKKTLLDFLDCLVAYRNRSRGHGAPSIQHQREFSQILLEGYKELLQRLEGLSRLQLTYVERTELLRSGAVHVLRVCNGLNSFILPERLTLPTADALASESVHLFSDAERPVIELSPVLVRPPHTDSFYYLNGNRKHVEYLCYDGVGDEYYRPDGYCEAIAEFLSVDENTMTDSPVTDRTVAAPPADEKNETKISRSETSAAFDTIAQNQPLDPPGRNLRAWGRDINTLCLNG